MPAILNASQRQIRRLIPDTRVHTLPTDRPAILIIDDDPSVIAILGNLLQTLVPNTPIIAMTDAAAALIAVARSTVALVITDFNMSGMNGLQLATGIKAYAPHTQVLLIPGYATPLLALLARQSAIDDYLPKPFRLKDLEHLVLAALERHAALVPLP